jgi:hypothetical protein
VSGQIQNLLNGMTYTRLSRGLSGRWNGWKNCSVDSPLDHLRLPEPGQGTMGCKEGVERSSRVTSSGSTHVALALAELDRLAVIMVASRDDREGEGRAVSLPDVRE